MDFWSPGSERTQEVKVHQSRLGKRKLWKSRREPLRLSEAGWWGRFRRRSGCATPPPPSLGEPWCPSTAPPLLEPGCRTPAEPANTPQLKIPETIPQNTPVCAGKTKDSPVRDTVSSSWSPGCRVSPTACSPGRAQPTGSGTFHSTGTDPPRPSTLESSSSSPPAPTAASPP